MTPRTKMKLSCMDLFLDERGLKVADQVMELRCKPGGYHFSLWTTDHCASNLYAGIPGVRVVGKICQVPTERTYGSPCVV
jgi:hypothetical protein